MNRRKFLKTACASALASSWLGTLAGMQQVHAAGSYAKGGVADYKALVCVFLDGGADTHNLLVPANSNTGNPATDHDVYAASRANMAIPQGSLLPVGNGDFGLHPGMEALQTLFASGQVAVAANVGSLIVPTTKSDWTNGTAPLPPQLFSHSDQFIQWQTAQADSILNQGWLGRSADFLTPGNGGPDLSMNISVVGNNVLQVGQTVVPYNVSTGGPIGLELGWRDGPERMQVVQDLIASGSPHLFEQEFANIKQRAMDNAELLNAALEGVPNYLTLERSSFHDQLNIVARLIAANQNPLLGQSRQTFVVRLGGWDTHDNQVADLPGLAADLSDALAEFYQATVTQGLEQDVTTFTMTEFGRTLNSNGNGTDHGWGGQQFVIGGAVNGYDSVDGSPSGIYGSMPDLTIDGPQDTGRGRLIPTYSVEQYSATLASWFGVSASDIDAVFPNLSNFPVGDIGFMAPA